MATARVEAHAVVGRCRMEGTTLVCNLIWPYNNFLLKHYTSSFLVLPSLASKLVKHKFNLHFSYLGASARVSTTQSTTWRTLLAITKVHLGYDNCDHLTLHQMVDHKVANGRERHNVVTLALGSRPKQGFAKVQAKREARESCHILFGVQTSVRKRTFTLSSERSS